MSDGLALDGAGQHTLGEVPLEERLDQHRDLLVALGSGNPDSFARSMKKHFNGIHTRLGE